jgi:hypothetical protein
MISLKRSPEENKSELEAVPSGEMEPYPWGLRINLDEETLEKLGIDALSVGSDVQFTAKAVVSDGHISESEENGKARSYSLQITHMDMAGKTSDSVAKEMYEE